MQYWNYSSTRGWVILDRAHSDHPCPRCGDPVYRMRRRLVDRLFGFRRHRFQCQLQGCDWEGDLPIEGTRSPAA